MLPAIIVEAALTQTLVTALDARARLDGITREREIERAVTHYLAWSHDHGEMRHADDIACDFTLGLPSAEALI